MNEQMTVLDRLLTEAINLSYVSGDNTKAQMRDKIIEARRITEEIKRGK